MAPNRTTTVPRSHRAFNLPASGAYPSWLVLPRWDTPQLKPQSTEWSHCGTIEDAKEYASWLMPGVFLDYIPKRDRDKRNWVGTDEYLDPQWGLLQWCSGEPPKSKGTIARTKMYVVGNIVGPTVEAVIKAARKQDAALRGSCLKVELAWTEKEEVRFRVWEELKRLKGIPPSHYWGQLDTLNADEMYELIGNKGATKQDFLTWMDLSPGKHGTDKLSDSMESLKLAEEGTDGHEAGDEMSKEWEKWEEMIKVELAEAMNEPGGSKVPEGPPTIPPDELLRLEID